MALDGKIRGDLNLPAVCAPMTMVSGPELVSQACQAGLVAALPLHNARSIEEFEQWMQRIDEQRKRHAELHPGARPGVLAVNLAASKGQEELVADLAVCARYGVTMFISAMGNPRDLASRVHDQGGLIIHDITSIAHAEKAIAAGVDGVTCIGAGGGGHAGVLSHLVLIPRVRQMFDGIIVMAGAVTNGAAIRAGEILGADLSYLGTRFIASAEARADPEYKQMLVAEGADRLIYTPSVSGVPASWLMASLERHGLDPNNLPVSKGLRDYSHLPEEVRPWRDLWSAGQGIDLIHDVPGVAEIVRRLCQEYIDACNAPDMAEAARLADMALSSGG